MVLHGDLGNPYTLWTAAQGVFEQGQGGVVMSRLGSPTDNLSRDWSGSAPDIGSQLTAENRSIEVGGDSLVYRRFGNTETNAPPLLCL